MLVSNFIFVNYYVNVPSFSLPSSISTTVPYYTG